MGKIFKYVKLLYKYLSKQITIVNLIFIISQVDYLLVLEMLPFVFLVIVCP